MSRQSVPILTLPVKATAALTSGKFVTGVGAVPAAGARVLGVSRFDAAIGDVTSVDVLGTALVITAGAIAQDAQIDTDATGAAVTHTSGVVVARALQAASAAGAIIEVMLIPN